eukprot:Skav213232  [mRNA]  locus=scaffold1151:66482:67783:+ [translate_table: standard]
MGFHCTMFHQETSDNLSCGGKRQRLVSDRVQRRWDEMDRVLLVSIGVERSAWTSTSRHFGGRVRSQISNFPAAAPPGRANVPKFGISHALSLVQPSAPQPQLTASLVSHEALGPWLAAEIPYLIESGVVSHKGSATWCCGLSGPCHLHWTVRTGEAAEAK